MNSKADSKADPKSARLPGPPPARHEPTPVRPRLRLSVSLDEGSATQVPAVAFELLRRLARVDSLREAANGFGFSYRYAWGLIRSAEQVLGTALVDTRRGRGTQLTDYGAMLAAALAEIESQLAPELDAATQALTAALALGAHRPGRDAPPVTTGGSPPIPASRDTALGTAWRGTAPATAKRRKGRKRAPS